MSSSEDNVVLYSGKPSHNLHKEEKSENYRLDTFEDFAYRKNTGKISQTEYSQIQQKKDSMLKTQRERTESLADESMTHKEKKALDGLKLLSPGKTGEGIIQLSLTQITQQDSSAMKEHDVQSPVKALPKFQTRKKIQIKRLSSAKPRHLLPQIMDLRLEAEEVTYMDEEIEDDTALNLKLGLNEAQETVLSRQSFNSARSNPV